MTVPLLHHDYGGRAPGRAGLHHATIAPYGAYRCGDGRHVVIAIQNEREWRRFCAVALGSESVADDPRFADNIARCANRAALDATIEAAFGTSDAGAVIGRLTQAGTAYASLNAVADLSSHPQLRRIKASTPSGPVVLRRRRFAGREMICGYQLSPRSVPTARLFAPSSRRRHSAAAECNSHKIRFDQLSGEWCARSDSNARPSDS